MRRVSSPGFVREVKGAQDAEGIAEDNYPVPDHDPDADPLDGFGDDDEGDDAGGGGGGGGGGDDGEGGDGGDDGQDGGQDGMMPMDEEEDMG